jgi:Holliday junction resolvasome RuvABC endonuclease subunit
MNFPKRSSLVLAIYFQTKGFGFVVLEHCFPVDWGTPEVVGPDREKRCLKHIDALLKLHTPDVVVLQDMSKTGTRRAPRIQVLNRRTLELAKRRGVLVRTYSREDVRDFFSALGATTKQQIAETIAEYIPVLSLYLPPPRKPWKTADPRMGIFDATALALTHLQSTDHVAQF